MKGLCIFGFISVGLEFLREDVDVTKKMDIVVLVYIQAYHLE